MELQERRKKLVKGVIAFLRDELQSDMEADSKESIEVAIQCLETAYNLEYVDFNTQKQELINLLELIEPCKQKEVSEEDKEQAESHKAKGNELVKNGLYVDAIKEYTKAINLHSENAVYYCNRAAAYSRLERHQDVINDCNKAIALDPTYGKAYSRLGVAYSGLERYEEAREAYKEALRLDPNNAMYETNLRLAEEKIYASMENAAPPEHRPVDISQFINNPSLVNMATQMLSDPGFRQMMSGLMSGIGQGDPGLDVIIQAGQDLAARMQNSNSDLVNDLRRTFNTQLNSTGDQSSNDKEDNDQNNEKTE